MKLWSKGIFKIFALVAMLCVVGSVFATSTSLSENISKIPNNKKIPLRGGAGLGTIMDSTLSGSGVISCKTIDIGKYLSKISNDNIILKYRWIRLYKVKHNGEGNLNVYVYKVPWGNYDIITIFPKDMTVYPEKATGAKFIGSWNYYTGNSVQSYHFCKDRWFVWSVHLKVPLKFNAGYGKHGILILGGSSSVMDKIIGYSGIETLFKKAVERFAISSNEIGIIFVAISTGANVDIIGFNEV